VDVLLPLPSQVRQQVACWALLVSPHWLAQVEVLLPWESHAAQHGSSVEQGPELVQSGSQPQSDWHDVVVSHAQSLSQSRSQKQPAWQDPVVSQLHSPLQSASQAQLGSHDQLVSHEQVLSQSRQNVSHGNCPPKSGSSQASPAHWPGSTHTRLNRIATRQCRWPVARRSPGARRCTPKPASPRRRTIAWSS
jgi:hypothetical protein